ncbi:MAG: FkbM family methyltransferase [Actinomycetota bacterium]|nr:FkbM family methyltransferase [Actinomycetota bacterium]
MRLVNRALGAASRRLGRPELLAAVNARARRIQQEAIGLRAVLAGTLGSHGTYVDVGTNRGQVLREALRVAPRGHHVAFEPIPALAAQLRSAFPQVDCRELALGARAEVAQFCHYTRLDGWSGLRERPEISHERGRPEQISVQVSTVDSELAGLAPSVVKIDVEGAELAVLEGARAVLSCARPLVILEHVQEAAALYGVQSGAVWDLLSSLDYEVFSVTGDGPFARADFLASAASASVVNWLATPGTRAAQ